MIMDLPGTFAFNCVSHDPLPLKVPVIPIWYVAVKPTLTTPSNVTPVPGIFACTKSTFLPNVSMRFLLLNVVDNFPDTLRSCGESDKVKAIILAPLT